MTNTLLTVYGGLFTPCPSNSYTETHIPTGMVLGGGALGRELGTRVEAA